MEGGKTVVQLLEFCQRTLFDWSRCWGYSDSSTLLDFLSSIRIDKGLLLSFCFFFSFVHYRELFVFLFFFLLIFLITYQKKEGGMNMIRNKNCSKDVGSSNNSIHNKLYNIAYI